MSASIWEVEEEAVAAEKAALHTLDLKPSFAQLLEQLHATGFTGRITLHCAHGVPKKVEFPGRQITLDTKGRR